MARALTFPDDVRPDFQGFGPKSFQFLKNLAQHNEKAWFDAHRDEYENELRFPMECLLGEFAPSRGTPTLPVVGDPKRGQFRIHRDVRFSKDKSPYKTHIGAVMTRAGGRHEPGVLYMHVQPGRCFVGAGFYRLETPVLGAWRRRMVEAPKPFLAIAKALARRAPMLGFSPSDALKTLPRGFAEHAESPVAPYLLWKDFLVSRDLPDTALHDRGLVDIIRDVGKAAAPLLAYGWEVHESLRDADPRRHMAHGA